LKKQVLELLKIMVFMAMVKNVQIKSGSINLYFAFMIETNKLDAALGMSSNRSF
jgi:hypothetical protein